MHELDQLRIDPSSWASVSFAACNSEERGVFDGNERPRRRALLALQYDCRTADAELVRHLFTHEILAAEHDSFQGCSSALILAAVLLARFRDPADVPLFARAKLANFETACGFPLEFVCVACGAQREEYLETHHRDLWVELVDRFGALTAPPEKLEAWWKSINDNYPNSAQGERPLAAYERALAFEDLALAREHLEQWIAHEPPSEAKRRQIKYEYARLGEFRKAAEVAASELDSSQDHWTQASTLLELAKLYRQAGELSLALGAARQLGVALAAFDDWVGVGLGRMAIHEVFELSQAHPETAAARDAFTLADGWFQRSRDLALVGMEAGAQAATRCGWERQAEEYASLAATERRRIEALLSNIQPT